MNSINVLPATQALHHQESALLAPKINNLSTGAKLRANKSALEESTQIGIRFVNQAIVLIAVISDLNFGN